MGKHGFSNYPAASNRIPASVGPMKAPRANTEVHRPDTLKWKLFLLKIMIIFGVVLHLPARKCRWYQGIRPAPEKSGYNKFVFYSFTIYYSECGSVGVCESRHHLGPQADAWAHSEFFLRNKKTICFTLKHK